MKIHIILFLTMLVGYGLPARALNVSPIELFLDSSQDDLVGSVKLENKTDQSMPVELKQFRRVHQNGKENRIATEDFLIYPPQIILKPKSVQTVRLIWQGLDKKKKTVSQEIAYRLLIKQVPLDLKANQKTKKKHESGLNFIYEYVASIYVQPQKSNLDMKISVVKHDEKSRNIEADIQNTGNVHLLLSFYEYFAKVKGLTTLVKLTPQEELVSTNLLVGEKRKFKFAGAKELSNKKIDIVYKAKNKNNGEK